MAGDVQYLYAYGGIEHGQRVRVAGQRGQWVFKALCRNLDTASEWVDVFGGTAGHQTMRSFRPELVTAMPQRRRRKVDVR